MKAIAEYFRDLAAEDRYFGAEPPAPDAEMLARIAEKEVSRRVEARIKDNNVVLRQQEAPALEPQRAAPSPIPPQPVARSAAAESPRKPAFQAAPAAAPASADADSIAAKLQRIRAVVAQNKAGTSDRLFDEDEQVGEIAEELNATAEPAAPAADPAPAPAPQPVLDDPDLIAAAAEEGEADAGDEEDSLAALEAFEQTAAPAPQAEEAFEEEAHEEESASKEAYEEEAFEEAGAYEDDAEADFAPEATDALLKAVASRTAIADVQDAPVEDALDEMEADLLPEADADSEIAEAEAEAEAAEGEAEEEAIEAVSDEAEAFEELVAEEAFEEEAYEEEAFEEAYEDDAEDAVAEETAQDEPADADADDDVLARLSASLNATPQEAAEEAEDEAADEEPLVLTAENSVQAEELAEDMAKDDDEDEARKASATAAAARARARVIRMKKSDVEDAIADGTLQPMELIEDDSEDEDEVAEADDAPSSLSDEEEADLRAELAAVEAEERGADPVAPVRPVRVTPRRVTTEAADDEEAVARLLEQTNSKLEESEGARRRSGFAHLKAAVAATVAERKFLGGKKKDEDETEAYREDLAKVVKPAKPAPAPAPAPVERPSRKAGTMAPLMLVSEQRVDVQADGRDVAARGAEAHEGEVTSGNLALQKKPRREVSVYELEKVDHVLADDTSFAEFAARLGVTELPDLLEAAAAYVAYVEGRPQFSRPHVMGIMAKAEAAGEISREDGLRSFGQLLREGRLQKVQRGQFTIAKTTRFKPKARYGNE
ncbi:hypothetical protein [Pseudoruegeria sp. SHC-113]|uniref:hypothetical protein n=1 Tax=Pseudoruegeria sp. SHC-113 TaxID=2855439 RepID=UPI0021BA7399|nr:hypothetical protein [Pseudoruegeria sp. SHC-113]MCT8159806.1 hypothetical protein [Pseudoruegeria sp. SHC-113]